MAIPIWKDTFYTTSSNNSPFTYSIECDGNTIFNGRAWAAPNEEYINIKINQIAQDYLSMSFPDLSAVSLTGATTFNDGNASKAFYLYDSNHSLVGSYAFVLDWSYKERGSLSAVSETVNYHGAAGMYYFYTYSDKANGVEIVNTEVSKNPALMDFDGNYCGNGALYYLDRNCGWCSFLIEGNIIRRDDYVRSSISKSYNNTTLERGKSVYNSQITPRWELHTSYLKDVESKRLSFNLLSSNQVYFHDLKEDRIYPVVISDATGEYKTVKNQGKKLVTYTINVTAAQTQLNLG